MQSVAFCPMRRSACVRPTDGRRLPFAGGGRIDRRDEHEAARARALRDLERDLRLVLAVQVEIVGAEAELGGDVDDGAQRRLLRDLDVGRNVATSPPIVLVQA